ncbi:MAG: LysR family transcriptional regulator [Xanthobacteraceae bacterium]|uniref:LysR family transcriptional regulator n=1 Tax=Pseudolabrys sp. TaxID=1960880 RepID=UPI003D108649
MKTSFAKTQTLAELRSLETVLSVLATFNAGTPLKAAGLLSRAPSTVYRAINRLENEIGAPLFDRRPSGWVPTDIGTRIVRLAQTIEREATETELMLLGRNAPFAAPLRLSASDALAEAYLAPLLADIMRSETSLKIELIVDNQFANLGRREADIAIRPSEKPGDGLVGRRAGKLAHALYCAAPLLKKHGSPASAADLSRFDACVLSSRFEHHTAATWWRNGIGERANVAFVAHTEMSLAAAIAAGVGIGVLPCFLGDQLKGVKRVTAIAVGPPVDIWLVAHRALMQNRLIRRLMQALAAAIKQDAATLAGLRK